MHRRCYCGRRSFVHWSAPRAAAAAKAAGVSSPRTAATTTTRASGKKPLMPLRPAAAAFIPPSSSSNSNRRRARVRGWTPVSRSADPLDPAGLTRAELRKLHDIDQEQQQTQTQSQKQEQASTDSDADHHFSEADAALARFEFAKAVLRRQQQQQRPPFDLIHSINNNNNNNNNKSNKDYNQGIETATQEPETASIASFKDIGTSQRVVENLAAQFGITAPTSIQAAIIPAIHSHRDIILKDYTGSGKSLGLVAAVLSKRHPLLYKPVSKEERRKDGADAIDPDVTGWAGDYEGAASGYMGSFLKRKMRRSRYVTTLILVPTPELAAQFYTWSRALLTGVNPRDIPKHVQCLVPHVALDTQMALLKSPTDGPPRVLISTPRRMLDVLDEDEDAVDLSQLQTVVIDEVDAMVRVLSRNPTWKERFKVMDHPTPLEVLMRRIVAIRRVESELSPHHIKKMKRAQDEEDASNDDEVDDDNARTKTVNRKPLPASLAINEGPRTRRLQVVLCSATMNNRVRAELERMKSWVRDPLFLDAIGSQSIRADDDEDRVVRVSPETVTHHCLVLQGPDADAAMAGIVVRDIKSHKEISDAYREAAASGRRAGGSEKEELFEMAVEDDSDVMLDAVEDVYRALDIRRGVLMVAPQISVVRVVDALRARGVLADRIMDTVNYDRVTGVANDPATDAKPSTHPKLFGSDTRLLVLTENVARGLDLPDLSHVIVLGPPSSPGSYLHMSGRVGRFGRTGTAITILNGARFESKMASILRLIGVEAAPLAQGVFGDSDPPAEE